jgi:DNA-binding MurR/RpiR family transcriptional regulator
MPASRSKGTTPFKSLSLEKRLHDSIGEMPATEQRIAELLLHTPGLLVTHTATELAALASTSKAAVSRFIHRLGYRSFTEARQEARAAQDWGSPLYLGQSTQEEHDTLIAKLAQHVSNDSANLDKTQRAQDEDTLRHGVERLAHARRVVCLGYRNSAWHAMYASTQLELLRENVTLSTDGVDRLASSFYGLGTDDLALVIALRRRVPLLLEALDFLERQRVPVLLITDPSGLAIAKRSHHVLTCHCQSGALFDSYAASMSLLNFLVSETAKTLGQTGRSRLRDIEALHQNLDDLI